MTGWMINAMVSIGRRKHSVVVSHSVNWNLCFLSIPVQRFRASQQTLPGRNLPTLRC
jgi:hypothetical protein